MLQLVALCYALHKKTCFPPQQSLKRCFFFKLTKLYQIENKWKEMQSLKNKLLVEVNALSEYERRLCDGLVNVTCLSPTASLNWSQILII